ncbi:MAG: hypothetical protein ACXV7J_07455 [Methylomonas sp.]
MTFCLAFAVPGVSLAVADTRVNVSYDSNVCSFHDGPNDVTVSVEKSKFEIAVPFKMRKIRPADFGWITTAGDYLFGKSVLDGLADRKIDRFENVRQFLDSEREKIKNEVKLMTGFSDEQLNSTIVIGAPFESKGVWLYSFNEARVHSSPFFGSYAANWPASVSASVKEQAEMVFKQEIENAIKGNSLTSFIRGAMRIASVASHAAVDVGPLAQVGITVASSKGQKLRCYLQGDSFKIASMNDEQIYDSLEIIP